MKRIFFFCLISLFAMTVSARKHADNLVIVTLDGMRWQEVMQGIDTSIVNDKNFTRDAYGMKKQYWANDVSKRRSLLFPFLWSEIASKGQIYGNRTMGNNANVANTYWFSYPGYNEIFTGYPDPDVKSNDNVYNKNETVLEFINKQQGYKNKVAVFASWGCFPYIFNNKKSGLYVNADKDKFDFHTPGFDLLNDMEALSPEPLGLRLDVVTYLAAREYLKKDHPKVLYIALDETDDYAHEGRYDDYIKSAYAEDGMLADLWETLQSMPGYKNNTSLLITCDHGRGTGAGWTSHGRFTPGSDQTWIAVMGPEVKPLGELKSKGQIYQKQLAATIAALVGMKFSSPHPVPDAIAQIFE